MSHFDVRMSFERTFGALEVGIFKPDSGLSYPALREVCFDQRVRAMIAVKPDEWPRLECGFREIDRLIRGVRVVDPMFVRKVGGTK